jgi:hypothetical protein
MPAVASVTDPTGSSIGYLPGGVAFNQITGAHSTPPSEGTQVITIPNPITGDYSIALRCATAGDFQFKVQYISDGIPMFTHDNTHTIINSGEWCITLHLEIENGVFISANVSDIEPMGDKILENIVTPTPPETTSPSPALTDGPGQSPETNQNFALIILSGKGGSVIMPGQGVFFYPAGTVVDLFAVPAKGWRFANWTGTVADSSVPATSITIIQSEVITANFIPER